MTHELIIDRVFASLFKDTTISSTYQKEKISKAFDLSGKQVKKEEIIKKIDDLEINFRKKMGEQREQFASELQKFNQKNPNADVKELSNFAEKMIYNYAEAIIT